MHASWLKVQEIRRFAFAVSRVDKHAVLSLFLSLHACPSSCLLLCHLVVRNDPVTISPGCIIDPVTISHRCIVDLVAIPRRVND